MIVPDKLTVEWTVFNRGGKHTQKTGTLLTITTNPVNGEHAYIIEWASRKITRVPLNDIQVVGWERKLWDNRDEVEQGDG